MVENLSLKLVKEFLERSRDSKVSRRHKEAKMEVSDMPKLDKVMWVTTMEEPDLDREHATPAQSHISVLEPQLSPTKLEIFIMMASCVLLGGREDGTYTATTDSPGNKDKKRCGTRSKKELRAARGQYLLYTMAI